MRERARAVVVGGGVGGCAILYWLARLGWSDVVLVERADLTGGSTFHSAGLVGQLRSSLSLTRMMMESVELYRTLAAEVGLETGWREVGSLRLASSEERMEEIARQAGWAKTFGLPLELVSAGEAQELFPPMSVDGVLGAAYLPTDGYVDPSQLTFALAEGARRRGAEIATHTRVTGIATAHGRVTAVETDKGRIETEVVVNAGGMFAGELGALAGVTVPVVPMAHEYLVLKPSGLPLEMPTMRDPSLLVYFRPESGGLIMGGYERHCAPWSLDGIPPDFNGRLLEEDWPRFEELMENAIVRVPSLAEMEVVRLVNGPEAFTPDGEFVLGPSDVRGLWLAAGFCAHGLAGAGRMGKLVAEWIVDGTPSLDVWHMDSRRFGAAYRSQAYTLARTKEVYETYYDVKYPGHERSAGRPLRVSAAYPRLVALGAAFGEKAGWERANWFEPNAASGDESLRPRGWAGELWSPAIGAEHVACRVWHDGRPVEPSPRQVLRAQIARAEALGLTPMVGSELEFYLVRETYAEAHAQGYEDLTPSVPYILDYHILASTYDEPLLRSIRNNMQAAGIRVETSKGEAWPGQQEINFRFADALTMADNHSIYKNGAKEIAFLHGCAISFMAKPFESWIGNSCHIHASLWREGRNAFARGDSQTTLFRRFLAGQIACARKSSRCSSHRRSTRTSATRRAAGRRRRSRGVTTIAPAAFASSGTARGCASRRGSPAATSTRTSPSRRSSRRASTGSRTSCGCRPRSRGTPTSRVPSGSRARCDAIDALEHGTVARAAFGDQVVDHYLNYARTEQGLFDRHVTDWERKRYFERT